MFCFFFKKMDSSSFVCSDCKKTVDVCQTANLKTMIMGKMQVLKVRKSTKHFCLFQEVYGKPEKKLVKIIKEQVYLATPDGNPTEPPNETIDALWR